MILFIWRWRTWSLVHWCDLHFTLIFTHQSGEFKIHSLPMFHPLPLSCMLPERMCECVNSQGNMSFHKTGDWGFISKSGQIQRTNSLRDTPKGIYHFFKQNPSISPFTLNRYNSMHLPLFHGLPGGLVLRIHPSIQETRVQSLGGEDPLKEEMATHSSILAWRIPRTEDPGGLQSLEAHRVGRD